ncbi:MAG: hypothetical protein RMY62_007790 [Nostoc sp. ZfuVER08]|uniref:Uncharacterized protein n=1 Tax=Nostoc punctiforme FACHB-252 TaxID=1357509 RepID=A0ABR8HI67_NOSPU|nr:hypothetical protein [Nostoc punctiforme]MBD2615543.1 hypothetical protein [Nostoc punctiforme FACHB-252]MDZ8013631.1 hypothetical protein [Nostoc sp. ZfuVER08]
MSASIFENIASGALVTIDEVREAGAHTFRCVAPVAAVLLTKKEYKSLNCKGTLASL